MAEPGLSRSTANAVCLERAAWVQIPVSPPCFTEGLSSWSLSRLESGRSPEKAMRVRAASLPPELEELGIAKPTRLESGHGESRWELDSPLFRQFGEYRRR